MHNFSLVTDLPLLRKDSGRAGMTGVISQLAEMLYALCCLTPEEIAIVEGIK